MERRHRGKTPNELLSHAGFLGDSIPLEAWVLQELHVIPGMRRRFGWWWVIWMSTHRSGRIRSVAAKVSMTPETLRGWVRRVSVDSGQRGGLTTDERGRMRQLECENRDLRRANEILKDASIFLWATLHCIDWYNNRRLQGEIVMRPGSNTGGSTAVEA